MFKISLVPQILHPWKCSRINSCCVDEQSKNSETSQASKMDLSEKIVKNS